MRGMRGKDASKGGTADGDMEGLITRERTAGRVGAEGEEESIGSEETKEGGIRMGGNHEDAEGEGEGAAWMVGAGRGKQGGGEEGDGAGAKTGGWEGKEIEVAVGIEVNEKGMRGEDVDAIARAGGGDGRNVTGNETPRTRQSRNND